MSDKLSQVLDFSHINLTDEFIEIVNRLENTKDHYFLTGNAGSGKSTLIAYFRSISSKNIAMVSPTGIGAMNVGGQTIHSFFDFPLTYIDLDAIHKSRKLEAMYRQLDTLIIDEISMVRADMMDGIEKTLRINRNSKLAFGGVQIIMVGDLAQLPPVVSDGESKLFINSNYKSEFFFDARIWKDLEDANPLLGIDNVLKTIQLKKIYRQSDQVFLGVLNSIRNGIINDDELAILNERVTTHSLNEILTSGVIVLSTNNRKVNQINSLKLNELHSKEIILEGTHSGDYIKNFPTEEKLILKPEAQIMMLKNDPERRWVNGSIGKVEKILNELLIVNINGNIYEVEKASWRKIKYQFNPMSNRLEEYETGNFSQYPVKLAWAITIHKSQGQTFDKVIIDIDKGVFAHGQLYVALSRCRTLEGITLLQSIQKRDIIYSESIRSWLDIIKRF